MPQRLIVLILVPTVAAVALAGLRISGSASRAAEYGRVEKMAELGEDVTRFLQEFIAERDTAIEYIASDRDPTLLDALQTRQRKTDEQLGPVRTAALRIDPSFGDQAVRDATTVLNRLDGVKAVRALATGTKVPAFTVLQKYTESAGELVNILDGLSQNVADDRLAAASRALGSLARAKEAVSRERALLLIGAHTRRLAGDELNALTAARAQEDSEIGAFRGSTSVQQRQRFEDTVVGPKIDQARDLRQRALSSASTTGGRLPASLGTGTAALVIRSAMTEMVDKMREVERSLAADIRAISDRQGADARQSTITDGIVATVLLLLVLLITAFMARSLVRPLRRLQQGALEIAGTRLPGLVDRLRDPEAAAGGIEVQPIDIDTTDEIGQVARAFDEVHREAVRLAADEAVLRGNINAMFVNLSRRSQSLIERQLRLIEELEQSERDEEQLGNLFRLDHLATRMRRNCENLLVLGGQEQARRWNRPVPLIDVVRASLSEVEQYERVALRVQGDMTVAGPVVNDLVHLLAELIENATVFSAEHTKVTVSGQLLSGGGSMLQITDNGVGISHEELEQANWRLANPPVIDFSAARRMGLFVVGRLAVRHGIRVELRAAQGGGLTAFVVLPDAIVSPGETTGIGARGLGAPRESAGTGHLALTPMTEPPPLGSGAYEQAGAAFAQDEPGSGPQPRIGTGGHPMMGGTGAQRVVGGTGPQRPVPPGSDRPRPTGPIPALGGSGAHAAPPGATGPIPMVPPVEQRPPLGQRPPGEGYPVEPFGSGSYPIDPHAADAFAAEGYPPPGDRRPPRQPGELPVREPGANLPGRGAPADDGRPNGLFQPRERTQEGGVRNGLYRPGRHTGPQSVVPEAQPMVPEPGSQRRIPWETGPLQQVGGDTHADGSPSGAHPRVPGGGAPWRETGPTPPEGAIPETPAADPSGYEHPVQAPPARASAGTPRVPERSPIFDAMQSEWFQYRSGGSSGEDPPKDWESPADAGFRAAEAVREPVAGARTSVGLPKRVPGKNRVPGAVARQQDPAGQGQAAPSPERPAQEPRAQAQSADVVRNRFASLQRGVHRGRTETRGGGTSGEVSSQGDDETGGTR
ncbi:nitrate- and nitrite sensing domain-containing protein [Actinomadura graeca]|uniref:histidine kinase n=1 Tax=Actinomadura graeca TaxID=2750812 RepID=A0ABX8QQP1_9ACTN|nr:nitrate- and nitrite sensing domain-containing protein [Actinomadura graeca]QXJ20509.1 nitrate- and nitrite sensing domain-containing protein [Actinomadura graeca]